ncbi:MAG: FAD-dependent monooxygenase [Burkholderiaceae bacterium]
MPHADFDIVISGAGPTGCALALLLAQKTRRPERIAVVGPSPGATGNRDSAAPTDPRTLALNYGSQALLAGLQAWPEAVAPITTVHVSQQGRLGRTLITPHELNVPRLGSVVAYDTLLHALQHALDQSGVTRLNDTVTDRELIGQGEQLRLTTHQGRHTCLVLIQSDGRKPHGIRRDYDQQALLVTVRASQARSGWAFERFTREGPLAILPHPSHDDAYGVVWCGRPQTINTLSTLDDTALQARLGEQFGSRLGTLTPVSPRHVYPLSMYAGPSLTAARQAAIGNAAQTLHPVAGQGLNLGLRDAAQLANSLAGWLQHPCTDPHPHLQQFAGQRQADRWITGAITDTLPRIFTTRQPAVEHACGLALLSLDMLPTLRTPLARHLLQGFRH